VRDVPKKGGVLVGFHERQSSYVADMRECAILPPRISALLPELRRLVESLSIRQRLPQIELAVGERLQRAPGGAGVDDASMGSASAKASDAAAGTGGAGAGTSGAGASASVSDARNGQPVYALVLRILAPLTPTDEVRLVAFADRHGVELWLQPGGPDTVTPFHPRNATLAYTLPEFDVALPFSPTEFTQVNTAINRVLVRRAVALLAPRPGERVADFFCGLGNFSLPLARRGAFVVGVEGSGALVARARANAQRNGLAGRTQFVAANLFAIDAAGLAALGPLDRVLIDPPREGAMALAKVLPEATSASALRRIVYVSCNPATLARDAAVLAHERGYRLAAAGVVNMFPHTAHVESIALFEP
jgi:23S rRNA (uracil1939-C5)-methyltransferase